MTQGERSEVEQSREHSDAGASVVVVAADAARQGQYGAALRMAQIPALVTLDADEAEGALGEASTSVLVLDQGLPRMVLFRLYGAVRADAAAPRTQVVFVGQEDDTGPDDHYLPGDPSPLMVAAEVSDLIANRDDDAAVATPAAAPAEAVTAPIATERDTQTATPGDADLDSAPPESRQSVKTEAVPVGAGAGVATSPIPVPAPPRAPDAVPTVAAERVKSGRRLDVILFRLGLAFLIVGAVLFFLQGGASLPWPLAAPTPVPAAPPSKPAASPSPAAWVDGSTVDLDRAVFSR